MKFSQVVTKIELLLHWGGGTFFESKKQGPPMRSPMLFTLNSRHDPHRLFCSP